jgi:hypothetical protein
MPTSMQAIGGSCARIAARRQSRYETIATSAPSEREKGPLLEALFSKVSFRTRCDAMRAVNWMWRDRHRSVRHGRSTWHALMT